MIGILVFLHKDVLLGDTSAQGIVNKNPGLSVHSQLHTYLHIFP